MRLSALLAAVVLLAFVGGAAATVPAAVASPSLDAGAPAAPQSSQPAFAPGPSTPVESVVGLDTPPETEIRIVLHDDGNATWQVTVEYELEDELETEAFDALAQDFEGGTADGPIDAETFERFVSIADNSTDREMSMTDVRRTGDREETTGTLRLEFVWIDFLAADGNRLVLDDALTTSDDDPLLGSLQHHQRLVVVTPDGYQVNTTPGVNPDLRDGNAWIEGPQTFTDENRLVITYSSVDRTESSPTPTPGAAIDVAWEILGGALLIGAVILLAALLYRRRTAEDAGSPSDAVVPTTDPGSPGAPSADSPPPDASDAGDAESEPGEQEDLSLLSDEERVERLLERSGGRMRQAAIVQETGWSDAKVSQLLSTMADEGRVEKLRLGRENLISLPNGDDDEE